MLIAKNKKINDPLSEKREGGGGSMRRGGSTGEAGRGKERYAATMQVIRFNIRSSKRDRGGGNFLHSDIK